MLLLVLLIEGGCCTVGRRLCVLRVKLADRQAPMGAVMVSYIRFKSWILERSLRYLLNDNRSAVCVGSVRFV